MTKYITLTITLLITSLQSIVAKEFPIFQGGEIVQIYLSSEEPSPVRVAAQHLQSDIEMVTGVTPEIIQDRERLSGNIIILSTAKNWTYTAVDKLEGLYESYQIAPIKSPFPRVDNALLVVGSDALGTAYGAFNISEQIGVSPLYWWCDIVPERQTEVILTNCKVTPHQPSVRYRGFFINDEEATIQWSQKVSQLKSQGITPETYKRIFELMLRLKANIIWPSMMEEGAFFFEAKDENGVAINPKNATEYGVYVGTSHCENMSRNNNAEWYEWAEKNRHLMSNDDKGLEFDYTVNPKAIEQYWRDRLVENKNFNIIYTMGIRAVHDSEFRHRKLENPTLENKVKIIQRVIDRQREMIAEVFGRADAVPQLFTPYEEMAEFYNGETKNGDEKCKGLEIPDDVIIITTDDNYGFLRQLPTTREVKRKGGSGVYYHIAYQGNPAPYDWLTTTPYKVIQKELQKLYNVGAMSFWIVNIGDIKPSEMGLRYFLEVANDTQKELARNPKEYLAESAIELFDMNKEDAEAFSNLFTRFCIAANRQKPEFMTSPMSISYDVPTWIKYQYYSLTDFGDEAERMIEDFNSMESEAKAIYDAMPQNRKDAFWHLAYYPIRSTRLMAEKSYYYYKNIIYYKQGRFASVNGYKRLSELAAEKIDQDLHYFNKELCESKWDGIMDPYGKYNIYERVVDDANIPKDFVYHVNFTEQAQCGIGSVCEGQLKGDENVSLLFSSLEDNSRFIDIFNKGLEPRSWRINSDKAWVKFSKSSGDVTIEDRIWVDIDWSKIIAGENKAQITVSDSDSIVKSYSVIAQNIVEKIKPRSYAEGAGFVAIEAEHFTKARKGAYSAKWCEVEDLGYSGSSMVVEGGRKVANPLSGAVLEYQVYFTSSGLFKATLFRIPTLNEGKGRSCEIAVGVDDSKPQILEGIRRKDMTVYGKNGGSWRTNAFSQMEKIKFDIMIDKPGYHTIKVYQVDTGIAFDRVVIATSAQSSEAQTRSLVGAPESYNNISNYSITSKHEGKPLAAVDITVAPYPTLTPMLYAKFVFANPSCFPVWGFTPVYTRNVYNKNSTLYGWRNDNKAPIMSRQIVGSRSLPFFRLLSHISSKPATFCATMHEGNYEVIIHTGTITSYYSGNKGTEYNMNIRANNTDLVRNLVVKSDEPFIGRYDVKVGKDNLLEIEFSGTAWGISMIEIYRK